jgi:DNA polymerase III epsilon subunit-like protein
MINYPKNVVVVDIETTGLDPNECHILQIGACFLHDSKYRFSVDVRYGALNTVWNKEAEAVHGITYEQACNSDRLEFDVAIKKFDEWLLSVKEELKDSSPSFIMAGSNPDFDWKFLNTFYQYTNMKSWRYGLPRITFPFARHTFSLQSMYITYHSIFNWDKNLPDSLGADSIYEAMGLEKEPKPHNALNGCLLEAAAFYKMMLFLRDKCYEDLFDA